VWERHRHRYEVNPDYVPALTSAGLIFSGTDDRSQRMESVELDRAAHPFFFACQYHPEFQSHPGAPSPPFHGFVLAASGQADKIPLVCTTAAAKPAAVAAAAAVALTAEPSDGAGGAGAGGPPSSQEAGGALSQMSSPTRQARVNASSNGFAAALSPLPDIAPGEAHRTGVSGGGILSGPPGAQPVPAKKRKAGEL
jgi:hypothetical protein